MGESLSILPRASKTSGKKWWREGRKHVNGKDIIRQVAKKYGAGVTEEELFAIDLHDFEPELYPKRHIRSYQVDLFITKRRGKELYRVAAEVDGAYHLERAKEDMLRDERIFQHYGIRIVRFNKEDLLAGKYSEQEIAELLGL